MRGAPQSGFSINASFLALSSLTVRKSCQHCLKVRTQIVPGSNVRNLVKPSSVATKLRSLCLCKVEMSLGGVAGSVSRRRGDHHIGAAPTSAGGGSTSIWLLQRFAGRGSSECPASGLIEEQKLTSLLCSVLTFSLCCYRSVSRIQCYGMWPCPLLERM
jgi:hypothetical protein